MAEVRPPEPEDAYVVYEDGDLPDPDADAPLIEHLYERTVPKETGAPWDMAAWIAADRARREAEGAFDAGGKSEVTVPGWRLAVSDLPTAARKVALRAQAAGFTVGGQACMVYVTPTLFASSTDSHSRGDLRFSDHDDTWWSVTAHLKRPAGLVAAFWASWVTKEQVGARSSTTFRDVTTYDAVLRKQYIGGSGAAGAFDAWLSVFAPAAPKPERRPKA